MRTDEGDLTMTETTVSRSLSEIALEKKAEQLEMISKMSSSNKNEIKARKIAVNIFDNGYKFVGMKFSDTAFDDAFYAVRRNKVFGCPENVRYFGAYKSSFDELSDGDKKSFLIYAHAVQSLKMCFEEPKKKELEKAEACGEPEKFLSAGCLSRLLRSWSAHGPNGGTATGA